MRWGSNHHDRSRAESRRSADHSLKQSGVFSPVLHDRGSVEDLERQRVTSPAGRVTSLPVTRRDPVFRPGLNKPIT